MKKKLLVVALVWIFVAGMSAYVLADFGEDDGGNEVFGEIIDFPPGGDPCYCPHIWAPVICSKENPDGTITKKYFSNACFAGCHGYTNCAGIVIKP
jgi:hypothetical protein